SRASGKGLCLKTTTCLEQRPTKSYSWGIYSAPRLRSLVMVLSAHMPPLPVTTLTFSSRGSAATATLLQAANAISTGSFRHPIHRWRPSNPQAVMPGRRYAQHGTADSYSLAPCLRHRYEETVDATFSS